MSNPNNRFHSPKTNYVKPTHGSGDKQKRHLPDEYTQEEFEITPDSTPENHKVILENLRDKILSEDPLPHASEPQNSTGQTTATKKAQDLPRIELPAGKAYFRMREVASIIGVEPHVIRFWESEFSVVRPNKSRSGQRIYRRKDVEALVDIRHLLHDKKITIKTARAYMLEKRRQNSQVSTKPQAAPVTQTKMVHSAATGTFSLKELHAELRQFIRLCQIDVLGK